MAATPLSQVGCQPSLASSLSSLSSGGSLSSGDSPRLRVSAFVMQEKHLKGRGERLPFPDAQRFEKCVVDRDKFVQRLPPDLAAARREADEYAAPVGRIGRAADEARSFEPVEPRRHRAGRDQGGLGQVCGFGAAGIADPAQCVQDVEVGDAEPERLEGGDDGALVVAGAKQQAPDDLQTAGVQLRVTVVPGLNDAVDRVVLHRANFSLTLSDHQVAWH